MQISNLKSQISKEHGYEREDDCEHVDEDKDKNKDKDKDKDEHEDENNRRFKICIALSSVVIWGTHHGNWSTTEGTRTGRD